MSFNGFYLGLFLSKGKLINDRLVDYQSFNSKTVTCVGLKQTKNFEIFDFEVPHPKFVDDILSYILNNPYFDNSFDVIKRLIMIYFALSSSNSEIERGFCTMKRIKTLSKNKLLSKNLDKLMIISLLGEDTKFLIVNLI